MSQNVNVAARENCRPLPNTPLAVAGKVLYRREHFFENRDHMDDFWRSCRFC